MFYELIFKKSHRNYLFFFDAQMIEKGYNFIWYLRNIRKRSME